MLSYAAISRLGLKNVAIITLEQLAPFPFDRVKEVCGKSCMEQHANFLCSVLGRSGVSGGFGCWRS